MPKKAGFTPAKYQQEILKTLKKEPFMSTSEVCKKLGMGYETGLKYLEQIYNNQKVKVKRIGNRKFWYCDKE